MNTLNVSANHLNSISIDRQLTFRFIDDKQYKINVSTMANRVIEKNCLHCFYAEYSALGGKALSKDVVNMVIQQTSIPQTVLCKTSIKKAIFMHIAKQISTMRIKGGKDIWRLACIITKQEYGFTISYLKWFFQRTF